ncbi:ethanolamine ammonia-lyase small subunit [Nocardioides zeae]|uniref:Ethanolamine ammonia-lyase small subunit n=1 Tax=Nocardioides zeae TaxID=1457234 RepID=A0ACC6IEI7_9ACTN|nr:ethanolamine ammonia-lyase subunit EutC [Nocardioides zeae]MDR6174327.1 ethanolamine ammonia-lyase small subunit [Nocardioides zeae]MDR6209132.1 ethanolamine ammonia-lyase small subunit [Nocardioides zeae]
MSDDDFWAALRRTTQSRIGLGRAGDTMALGDVLAFRAAHAQARDAVHVPVDVDALVADLESRGLGTPLLVASRVGDRGEYLRRPDLGRQPRELDHLPRDTGADIGIVLADGLSGQALTDHAPALVAALVERLTPRYSLAPLVVATNARVALGDHVGAHLGVETLLVLVGERPGLSVPSSLGIYLTHHPRPGRRDSERNCISNVHPPDGLDHDHAARIVDALVAGARELGESGVRLKDTSRSLDAAADGPVALS